MSARRHFLFCFLLFFSLILCAQNETNKWYFGNGTGLDFMSTPPSTIATSAMLTPEGCASFADNAGNLLFYTNGVTIWDRTHNVMANGNGLLGHASSSQSSLILPQPGSTNLYYVFSQVGNNTPLVPNVNYSIVDMTLAGGNGSVTTKNSVLNSDPNTECLAATRHCNGVDWWVVIHLRSSNAYMSFLLTTTGIAPGFTVSAVGPSILSGFSQMKISPNGRKLALSFNGAVYLGDFDNSTGQVYNVSTIQNSTSGYGCEFSPDGSKLYTTATGGVVQYDLCGNTPAAIASSSFFVYSQNAAFGSMQLASNGKIYLAYNTTTTTCHVINNPNLYGIACNYAAAAHTFIPRSTQAGLPNFPGCYFYKKPVLNPFYYQVSSNYGCYGAYFNAFVNASTCAAISNSISGITWDFGDPVSGPNNISYSSSTVHNFSGNGTYTVSLLIYYVCSVATDTLKQVVVINDNCLSYVSSPVSCSSLGTATITSAQGVGPFTFNWIPGSQTGTIATNLTPGSHTVVVTDVLANYTYSVPIFLATASQLSANVNVLGGPVCYGANSGSASITGIAGGTGSQTYTWTNGTQGSNVQNPVNLSAGSWTATVTDAVTGCKVTSVVTISQPPALTLNISPPTPTACVGTSIAVTAINSGGTPAYTYTWLSGPQSATQVISKNLAGNYVYSVSSRDANNCSVTTTVNVTFLNGPSMTVPSVSVCPQSVGTLTASGASTYTWFSAGSVAGSNATFTDIPLATTQYTVIGTAQGCTAAATASIINYPPPQPVISSNSPVCENADLLLSASGAATYHWTGPLGLNLFTNAVNVNSVSLSHAGIYTLTATSVNSCAITITVLVVVNSTPAVTASSSTVCTTQTLSFAGNGPPGSQYFWSGPMGFISLQQNPQIVNPVVGRSGQYTLRITSATGCTNATQASALVVVPPLLTISRSDYSLCAQPLSSSPNTISVNASGASTYTFLIPSPLAGNPVGSSAYVVASSFPQGMPITATGTVEGSNGVCAVTSTFTFMVMNNPTISVQSSTPAVCAGTQFSATVSGANTYSWVGNYPAYTVSGGGLAITTTPSLTSVFYVTGETAGCRSSSQSASVTVKPIPVFTISSSAAAICLNDEAKFTVNGTATSYAWNPGTALSSVTGSVVMARPQANQSYTVVGSVNNCTNSSVVSVTVLPLPSPKITAASPKVCIHDSVYFLGSGGVNYLWRDDRGVQYNRRLVAFETTEATANAGYTLMVTDANGCSNTTTTSIQVLELPRADLADLVTEACHPYCAMYTLDAVNKSITGLWNLNGQNFNGDFNYCYPGPGTYTITGLLRDAATTCTSSVKYSITVNPKPEAAFEVTPEHPVEGLDEVNFINRSTGQSIISYSWSVEDKVNYFTKAYNAEYLFESQGMYRAALVVTNQWKCTDTALHVVEVAPDFALYVPNSFTPNHDQLNDVFRPVMRSAKNYQIKIYDRWGVVVYSSNNIGDGWDGTYRGEDAKQDVYNWFIELSTEGGTRKNLQGTVMLLRQ